MNAPFIECCEAKWIHFIFSGPFDPGFHSLWVRDHSKWTKQWQLRMLWTANRKQLSRSHICLSFRKKDRLLDQVWIWCVKLKCCAVQKKGERKQKIPVNRCVCKCFSNIFSAATLHRYSWLFSTVFNCSFPWYSSNMTVGFQLILEFGQKWRCFQLVSKYDMIVNLIPNVNAQNEMCLRSWVFIFHLILRLIQSEISMLPRTPTRQTRGRRSPSTAHLNSFSRDSSSSTFGKIIFTRLTLWKNRHWHVSPNSQKLISVSCNRHLVIIHSRLD